MIFASHRPGAGVEGPLLLGQARRRITRLRGVHPHVEEREGAGTTFTT